jgi:tetratricopeptide (TPR) repeat protein
MKHSLVSFFLAGLVTLTLWGQGDYRKGISFFKQKQYAKAAAEFEQIVKDSPDYESGFRVLGKCYLEVKQYRKAANAFARSIELKEDSFVSYLGASIAHFNLDEHSRAAALLLRAEKYAKSQMDRYQLYEARGSAYFKLRDFSKAIADLEKANSLKRGEFRNLQQLGIAYYQTKDFKKARTYLEQTQALNPEATETKQILLDIDYQDAMNALAAEDYTTAATLFKGFTAKNPEDGEAWFNLGLSQLFAEQLDAAEQSFLRSSELLPENWQTHDRLGYIYEKKQQYQRSLDSYQKALSLHQDSRLSESVDRLEERIRREKL